MTTLAMEKRVKWKTISNIFNLWEIYDNKYVKLIVLIDTNNLNEDRLSAKKSTESYKNVDDLFIQELWKNVHNKVIN